MSKKHARSHFHRWPFAALVAAGMTALLLAAPAAEAKKKKKKGDEEIGVLSGVVMNQAGETLGDARVEVTAGDGSGFTAAAETDKKGEFEIELPAVVAEYRVSFRHADYAPFEVEVQVTPGERQNVEVRLLDEAAATQQSVAAEYNAGVQAFNAGDMMQAKGHFQAALEIDPAMVDAQLGLAEIYLREKNYAEAAAAAEAYLAVRPEEDRARRVAFTAYTRAGDDERAARLGAQLVGSEHAAGMAVEAYNAGALASQEEDLERAVRKFELAIELDPTLEEAYAALARVHYNRAEVDAEAYGKALSAIEKLLEIDPDDPEGLRLHYLVHDARADLEAASAALDAYAAVEPAAAAHLLYQRADLDFRGGNPAAAITALKKVLALQPDMPRAHYTLGLAYASLDAAKAKEHLRKFLELAPDDPEAEAAREMLANF